MSIIGCVETITTRRGKHAVYTREEADAEGIAYRPWYEVQTEEWGLTDDGFVLQCLYAGDLRMSKNGARGRYLRFSGGRCWTREGRKRYPFEWLKRKEAYARWSVSGQSWDAKESKKTRTKNVVRAMATYIASGSAPDWKKLGDIYRKDQQIPEATVRRLFKSEVIQTMLDKELAQILVRQGLTKEYVIKNMKAVVELALASNDLTNMRLQLKDIGEILEVFPKKMSEFDPTREIPAVEQLPELDMNEDDQRMLEARKDIGTE